MPLTTKIKRLLVPAKGKYVHKLYPDEYFSRQWLNKTTTINLKFFSRYMKVTQKEIDLMNIQYFRPRNSLNILGTHVTFKIE